MKLRKFAALVFSLALVASTGAVAFADTLRLRDGSVIRGQIVGYKDQQFTVLIGGARGRRSRITIYAEDVESIEFDNAAAASGAGSPQPDDNSAVYDTTNTQPAPADTRTAPPASRQSPPQSAPPSDAGASRNTGGSAGVSPVFFPIRLRVRADNASNGWTDSGLMVRKGQRLRVSAQGRVSLGAGLYSTPTGLPRQADRDKLMRDQPTGGLIAVIGDDNDEFIFLGAGREFIAQRDGRLFLGVNEGNLADNTGAYDVTVEAEAVAGNRE
ncbi:MAG TPA: hypothetical protein VM864_06155 [Pyrinomonadaceae bacterium]|jgi:hypothetical protein|nr:hypothetical protein [Pyrinomonadaceae bacterium]